jgi:hypothetical protein
LLLRRELGLDRLQLFLGNLRCKSVRTKMKHEQAYMLAFPAPRPPASVLAPPSSSRPAPPVFPDPAAWPAVFMRCNGMLMMNIENECRRRSFWDRRNHGALSNHDYGNSAYFPQIIGVTYAAQRIFSRSAPRILDWRVGCACTSPSLHPGAYHNDGPYSLFSGRQLV